MTNTTAELGDERTVISFNSTKSTVDECNFYIQNSKLLEKLRQDRIFPSMSDVLRAGVLYFMTCPTEQAKQILAKCSSNEGFKTELLSHNKGVRKN